MRSATNAPFRRDRAERVEDAALIAGLKIEAAIAELGPEDVLVG